MASVLGAVEAGFTSPDLTAPLVEASEHLAGLVEEAAYVGEVYSLGYDDALVQIHDYHRRRVGGIPALSFLLATRYARGVPAVQDSHLFLGDCTRQVEGLASRWAERTIQPARLLLTSPPYFKLANYHYDQWLRLWMLGGNPDANRPGGENRGKFEGRTAYSNLLVTAFRRASAYLALDAVIYVRTGSRSVTYQATTAALAQVFPNHGVVAEGRPYTRPTQTRLFGDHELKAGEVDLILRVSLRLCSRHGKTADRTDLVRPRAVLLCDARCLLCALRLSAILCLQCSITPSGAIVKALRLRRISVFVSDLGKKQASHSEHTKGVAFGIAAVPYLMPARIPEGKCESCG